MTWVVLNNACTAAKNDFLEYLKDINCVPTIWSTINTMKYRFHYDTKGCN